MNSARVPGTYRLIKSSLGAVVLAGTLLATGIAPASADAAGEHYVALGDSFASGPLVPDITGPLACGRSTHNYPHELAARLHVASFKDVTCSGAATKHTTEPQSGSVLGLPTGTEPPQFDALGPDTTLVTLTFGGNDAGLVGVAQDCMTLDPGAKPCKDRFAAQVDQRIEEFKPRIAAVLDGIHARSPKARVVATGYGDYIRPGGCFPLQPVLGVDADFLQGSVDRLNAAVAEAAAAHGADYADVRTPSKGHDSCAAPGDRWIEGYVPVHLAAPLHPNRQGEESYARIIGDQLQLQLQSQSQSQSQLQLQKG
ncbi:SGNH/GDSL hydrolase family protein [Streptomyces sp. NPDC059009]|uniref:SGNH/GDSL hydrolase family protein n=1 Tax=Streptomyces sp. NPDC059009 TaxID=3346694 RepID=UPI00368F4CA6